MSRSAFRHATEIAVRNYEIDWQGIVHNGNYLLYCEVGRIRYLQELGLPVSVETIQGDSRIVVVRNEIDYRSTARFGENLRVLTRISKIGTTSFTFEGLIEEVTTGRIIAENISVHVWLDRTTGEPVQVPENFRALIAGFEGKNLASR
jgi:acyl-CoA thioester hydrolase